MDPRTVKGARNGSPRTNGGNGCSTAANRTRRETDNAGQQFLLIANGRRQHVFGLQLILEHGKPRQRKRISATPGGADRDQNPLEPQDSSAFMGQLAQFSQLEQLTQINDQLTQLETTASASASGDTYTGSDSTEDRKLRTHHAQHVQHRAYGA
ncbi:MAG: flagellar hook capping FlgD N-terminal domain-containing protein [Paludibaculum sp.]